MLLNSFCIFKYRVVNALYSIRNVKLSKEPVGTYKTTQVLLIEYNIRKFSK